jgi:hypothetical protein
VRTGQRRVTWKTTSSEAFVPLQDSVAILAFLRSPQANAGMKQYECGPTQPLFLAGHNRGKTCMLKPKGLRLILIIMKHISMRIRIMSQDSQMNAGRRLIFL